MSGTENLRGKALSFLKSLDRERDLKREHLEAERLERARYHNEAVASFKIFEEDIRTLKPGLLDVLGFLKKDVFEGRGQVKRWQRIIKEERFVVGSFGSDGPGMNSGSMPQIETRWFQQEIASFDFMPHLRIKFVISREEVSKRNRSLYPRVPTMTLCGEASGDLVGKLMWKKGIRKHQAEKEKYPVVGKRGLCGVDTKEVVKEVEERLTNFLEEVFAS